MKVISALRNVQELTVYGFSGIRDLSGLENVRKLDVSYTPQLSSISMLKKVEELDIMECRKISDFNGLHSLKKLTIGFEYDESVENFPSPFRVIDGIDILQSLEECSLNGIIFNEDHERRNESELSFRHLQYIPRLSFTFCVFRSFPQGMFDHLQSLSLEECNEFTSLPDLPSLRYLTIYGCEGLKYLRLSSNSKFPLYSVKILGCSALIEIIVTRRINCMNIWHCSRLSQLTIKNQVDHLRTKSCKNMKRLNLFSPVKRMEINPHDDVDCLADYLDDATDDDSSEES
jgi:hypothetical protein